MNDSTLASMMSCLQAGEQDDMLAVMQAGCKDGWHCIHCE